MRLIVFGVLALVIAAGGWFGWNAYESGQETKFAAQAVQTSAVQAERQFMARKEDGITFAEYFKRGAATLESLDQSIAGLDAKNWEHKRSDRDVVVAFIEQCKSNIRSGIAETRLVMEANSARETLDAAKKELDAADSSVAIKWTNQRYQRASTALLEVLGKQITNVEESTAKIQKLIAADESVKSTFGAEKGLSADMVARLKKSISTEG